MARKFTAEEMREIADELGLVNDEYHCKASAMLIQSADMMEREESDIVCCRKCQTERTGEGYGEVPPSVGEDDICDRCEIAEHLRRGKDELVREKKYEYAIIWDYDDSLCEMSIFHDYIKRRMDEINSDGVACHLVRREVGEWEEVPE